MKHLLTELLYYNTEDKKYADLKISLKEYQLLLSALQGSLLALEKGDLEKFDSIVGENACQIRAIKIALIHSNHSINFIDAQTNVWLILEKINYLLLPKQIDPLMKNGVSLKEVLAEHNLNIQLSSLEFFTLSSYLLTEMKKKKPSSEILSCLLGYSKCAPVQLKRLHPDISTSFAKTLASHLRKNLCASSVEFVRDAAKEIQDPYLMEMVSDTHTIIHNALKCIPMFWTYKILLKAAQKNKIPLVIEVQFLETHPEGYKITHNKTLFFKPSDDLNESYALTTPSEFDLEKAACVIQGFAHSESNWNESLVVESITDVILAGAADHRQYPNPDHHIPIQDTEFESFKLKAKTDGFSLENPSTFFIQHVYPAQVKKFFSNSHNKVTI